MVVAKSKFKPTKVMLERMVELITVARKDGADGNQSRATPDEARRMFKFVLNRSGKELFVTSDGRRASGWAV